MKVAGDVSSKGFGKRKTKGRVETGTVFKCHSQVMARIRGRVPEQLGGLDWHAKKKCGKGNYHT